MAAALPQELCQLMAGIEDTVAKLSRAGRWKDLEDELTAYGEGLQIDPAFLLNSCLLWRLEQHALTITDPDQYAECVGHCRSAALNASSGMSLRDAIDSLRTAVEHRPAFDAFDALGDETSPRMVH